MLLLLKGRMKTDLVFQTTFSLSLRKKCGQIPKHFSNFKNFKIFARTRGGFRTIQ